MFVGGDRNAKKLPVAAGAGRARSNDLFAFTIFARPVRKFPSVSFAERRADEKSNDDRSPRMLVSMHRLRQEQSSSSPRAAPQTLLSAAIASQAIVVSVEL
jgi:hypothetical protein